jgi:superfamily II DNA/RNA helicase
MPKQRRTGLFSATMPTQLKNFINIGMRNPYFVDVLNKDDIFIKGKHGIDSSKDLKESV